MSRVSSLLPWWEAVPLRSQATHRVGFTLAAQDFGDAKVSNLDNHTMFVQEDVLSLQVTVQDLFGVHVVKSQEDLHEEVQDGILIQQGITALVNELGQRAPCEERQRPSARVAAQGSTNPA